jgi:hypothetical protein
MNKAAVGNLRIIKNQFSMQPAMHRGTQVSVHTKTQHMEANVVITAAVNNHVMDWLMYTEEEAEI